VPYSLKSVRHRITWKTILLPIIGLSAFFLYLYLFEVDIQEIVATIQRIDLSIYLVAVFIQMLETFFFALSWRSLVRYLSVKLSVGRALLYVWYGIFMDIIIPVESISGDISRVYLISREQNGTSGKVVASLVTHRLMGMGINIASLFIGIGLLYSGGQVDGMILVLITFLAVATTVSLLLLFSLCIKETWTFRIIDAIIRFVEFLSRGRWKLEKMREDITRIAKMFYDSMRSYRHAPKTLSFALAFYVFGWIFSLVVTYLVFLSLRHPVSWSVIIITGSIVIAIRAIPIGIPFEVGLPEITMTTLYTILGVPFDIAATSTILTRILTIWLRFFIGFAAQQWLELRAIKMPSINNDSESL